MNNFFTNIFENLSNGVILATCFNKMGKIENIQPFGQDDYQDFLAFIEESKERYNLYFSVCPHDKNKLEMLDEERRAQNKGISRGNMDTVSQMTCFWLDIDILGPNHKATNLPPSMEVALKIIQEAFPLQPTYVVFTGGGLHMHWRLIEPIEITNEEELSHAATLQRSFHNHFQRAFNAHGYKIDNTSDLARILRVPGSYNFKNGGKVEVEILESESSNVEYNLSEIQEFIIEDAEVTGINPKFKACIQQSVEALFSCDFLKHCYDNAANLPEPDWYAMLSNLSALRPGGYELCHRLSQNYPGYSKDETDRKIMQAMNASAPITCRQIQSQGFVCSKNCGVKSPIVLINRLANNPNNQNSNSYEDPIHTKSSFSEEEGGALLVETATSTDLYNEVFLKNCYIASLNQPDLFSKVIAALKNRKDVDYEAWNESFNNFKREKAAMPAQKRVLQELKLPDGYGIVNNSIVKYELKPPKKGEEKEEWAAIEVCKHIIGVTQICEKLSDSKQLSEITFIKNGCKSQIKYPREKLASGEITGLSAYGIHANSLNAKRLMSFLSDFEEKNLKEIPRSILVENLGWVKVNDSDLFYCGSNLLYNKENCPMKNPDNDLTLYLEDGSMKDYIDGIEQSGSREAWLDMAKRLNPYPYFKVGIAAAIVSPLIKMLNIPNFMVHLGDPSSGGKTTVVKAALSAFGNPDRLKLSWSTTAVGAERLLGFFQNLLVVLDETKTIQLPEQKKAQFIAKTVYMHSNGRGKVRGSINSLRKTNSWSSIILSTGESNLLDMVPDGGAQARVLDLPGIPLLEKSAKAALVAEEIEELAMENYGHALPDVIQYFIDKPDEIDKQKERLKELTEEIRVKLPSGIGSRIAKMIATIVLGCEICDRILALEWSINDVIEALIEPCKQVAEEGSEAQKALDYVYSQLVSLPRSGKEVIHYGIVIGRIEDEKFLVGSDGLKRLLSEEGFNKSSIVKEWARNGWLDGNQKAKYQVRLELESGGAPRAYCINKAGLIAAGVEFPEDEFSFML